MPRLSLIARLHRAGINPTAAALATVATAMAVAVSVNDRQLIQSCQSNGGNPTVCTLKIAGR